MAEIILPVRDGIIAGLVLSILIGPVFFALLQASIEKGFLVGLVFAFGIICSDSLFFLLAFVGLSQINETEQVHGIMGVIGGAFLLLFGIRLILKKHRKERKMRVRVSTRSIISSYFKGFLMNALNPQVFLYWALVVTAASARYKSDDNQVFAFFIAAMTIVFTTDSLKAYLAYKLKHIVTPNFILWLNRISGAILVIAGTKLLVTGIMSWEVFK